MEAGKPRDTGHTVSNRAANGIERTEDSIRGDMFLDIFNNSMKLVQRLRRLRIKIDITLEVQLSDIIEMLNNNGMTQRLTYQSEDLSMSFLTKDNNLAVV